MARLGFVVVVFYVFVRLCGPVAPSPPSPASEANDRCDDFNLSTLCDSRPETANELNLKLN